jgi:hypothetical protein
VTITEQLQHQLSIFETENAKFDGGNKSAGTRARNALLEIKKLCDLRRKEIQEAKSA